ncbi:unnamed protein product, partial [Iphiclides podalirius]
MFISGDNYLNLFLLTFLNDLYAFVLEVSRKTRQVPYAHYTPRIGEGKMTNAGMRKNVTVLGGQCKKKQRDSGGVEKKPSFVEPVACT